MGNDGGVALAIFPLNESLEYLEKLHSSSACCKRAYDGALPPLKHTVKPKVLRSAIWRKTSEELLKPKRPQPGRASQHGEAHPVRGAAERAESWGSGFWYFLGGRP